MSFAVYQIIQAKCYSNAIQTCVLPFSSNVPLLFPPVKQLIDSKYFFCKRSVKFIPIDKACDGRDDCTGGEDEITCVSSFTVNTTFPGKTNTWLFLVLSSRTQKQSVTELTPLLFLFCAIPPSSASRVSSACPAGVQTWLRLAECV